MSVAAGVCVFCARWPSSLVFRVKDRVELRLGDWEIGGLGNWEIGELLKSLSPSLRARGVAKQL